MPADLWSWVEVWDAPSSRWKVVRRRFPADEFDRKLYGSDFISWPFHRAGSNVVAFLAGVNNYHGCEVLGESRGLPADCDWTGGCEVINEFEPAPDLHVHSVTDLYRGFQWHSWLLLSEVLAFDCEKELHIPGYRRTPGGERVPAEGRDTTYREFLGARFFEHLEVLKSLGEPSYVRVVFCFN